MAITREHAANYLGHRSTLVPNNWVLGILVLAITVQILEECDYLVLGLLGNLQDKPASHMKQGFDYGFA